MFEHFVTFAEIRVNDSGGGLGGALCGMCGNLLFLALIAAGLAGLWGTFAKAGKPGWAAIVPVYNVIVLLEIVGKPLWWVVLFFIPCVSFVMAILVALEVAKVFGKDVAFGVGLALLPFVFYPILGFGDARYQGAPPQS